MQIDYVKRLFCFDGKKAVVTGGNSGIGLSIATSLASLGADVAILGRDQKTLDEAEDKLRALGTDSRAYKVDISNVAEIESFFNGYYAENGLALDILVANAGVTYRKRALETTEEEFDTLVNTNLKGTLFCCRRAAEAMKERRCGNIIIVTSVNALYPLPPQAVYTGTKCALEGIMQCIAVDLAKYGIRVNTLAPGAVRTNLGRNNPVPPEQRPAGNTRPGIPLQRVGMPDDMGDAVACLVSDAFRYMTGSTVLIDGGMKLRNI